MGIELACGRKVQLDSFYTEPTYAGLILGRPTPEMNTNIVAETRTRVVTLWGKDRPIHIIPPVIRDVGGLEFFPEVTNYAWLLSDPFTPEFEGSQLIVIWFGPSLLELPLSTVISIAIRDISWVNLAKDWNH